MFIYFCTPAWLQQNVCQRLNIKFNPLVDFPRTPAAQLSKTNDPGNEITTQSRLLRFINNSERILWTAIALTTGQRFAWAGKALIDIFFYFEHVNTEENKQWNKSFQKE